MLRSINIYRSSQEKRHPRVPLIELIVMVPLEGLEPPRLSAKDFESSASTIPPQGHYFQSWHQLIL